jgi:hypothetical protein
LKQTAEFTGSSKEVIRGQLMARKRNQAFTSWYEYLKENADIEDNRKFFNL